MTFKHLTGAYPAGYALSAKYSGLDIEATATVGGTGVSADFYATIRNFGAVNAAAGSDGVSLSAGGVLTNGSASDTTALIDGSNGVYSRSASVAIGNFGTIEGASGVVLYHGGAVTNGSASDTTALIKGASSGVYDRTGTTTIINFGTVSGASGAAVAIQSGTVINGSATDTKALIEGYSGVYGGSTTTNYGTIDGMRYGVDGGGVVTNGSASDTTALIEGGEIGVGRSASINNFGTISGAAQGGVVLFGGGTVTNGSASDTAASIGAPIGVSSRFARVTIANFGTISGSRDAGDSGLNSGVFLYGGSIANGSATDNLALIEGYTGILNRDVPATIANFGAIEGAEGGVYLGRGGKLTNGTAGDTTALIEGGSGGVYARYGVDRIANFGVIEGAATAGGYGVQLSARGWLTNGSAADAEALISGDVGLYVRNRTVTVTNFGTIEGTGGTALRFGGVDTLRVEAGCVFEGAVLGGGGTLVLASGRQTIDSIVLGDVTVSGRGRTTTFSNFGTLDIAKGARFTLTGSGVIGPGGHLTVNGALAVAGYLDVGGTLTGAGTIALKGGATAEVDNGAPSSLSMSFSGPDATLALKNPSAFAATIAGFAATDTIDLLKIAATSAVLGSGDTLIITNGSKAVATLQLAGNYTGAAFAATSDGAGGTDITISTSAAVAPAAGIAAPAHAFVAAAASLGAGAGAAHLSAHAPTAGGRPMLSVPRVQIA